MSLLTIAGTVARGRAIAWGVAACMAAIVAAFGAGMWAGTRWEQGRQATRNVASLETQVDALAGQVGEYATAVAAASNDLTGAQQSLGAIAKETADDIEQRHRAAEAAARDLHAVLATHADLDHVRVGDDILYYWNQANAGPGAHSGAAAGAADPPPDSGPDADPVVPEAALGARRSRDEPDRKSPGCGGTLSRLRSPAGWPFTGQPGTRAARGRTHRARPRSAATNEALTMADFADEASRIEELHRKAALAALRAKLDHQGGLAEPARGYDSSRPRWCLDCGELIPIERLRASPMTSRCTDCLAVVERRLRSGTWMA